MNGKESVSGKKQMLVTGCTGVTGNALVRYLLSRGFAVTAVVRPGSHRKMFLPRSPQLTVVEYSLDSYKQMGKELPHGVYQAFFHLAWEGSHGKEKGDLRNAMGMQLENARHLLEAVEVCHGLDCPVFLAVGSQAEYGFREALEAPVDEKIPCRPENGYGAAKQCARIMAEILCKDYGIRFLWARLFSVYGPRDGTHSMIDAAVAGLLHGQPPMHTSGEQIWNYLYAFDAAKALTLLALTEKAEGVYCVASEESRPLKEYIHTLYEVVSPGKHPILGGIPDSKGKPVPMRVDIARLTRDTGFQEEYTFQQGIARIRDWYLETGGISGDGRLV